MSAPWLLYALAVGAVLTLAALAAEQSCVLARRPARGMWALAMALCVGLPLLALLGRGERAAPPITVIAAPEAGGLASAAHALGQVSALAGGWLPSPPAAAPLVVNVGGGHGAALAWLLLSLATAAAPALAAVSLRRRRRGWREASLAGSAVLVAADAGPAVVGLWPARIVVPAWLLAAPPQRQALVLAHEQSHIDAGDQRLLAAAWLLLVAMPWNPALWFQLRRLRRAIEIDCDARVLAQGFRLADYGAALIEVGARPSGLAPLAVAMATSSSLLERRLRLMTRRPARWQRLAAPLLLLLSIDLGAAAARMQPPPTMVSVALAQRQPLAGYYRLGKQRIAIVSVDAEGLSMKTNMEPSLRLLPQSAELYQVAGSELMVRFDRAAATLTLEQAGAAADPAPRVDGTAVEQADAYVAQRLADGQALPGGEAIVRRNIGASSYQQLQPGDFSPSFLRLAAPAMALQAQRLRDWGPVREVRFDGVNRWGWDCYQVRYARRTVRWAIWLDGQGRIEAVFPELPQR